MIEKETLYKNKDWLYQKYIVETLSSTQMAKIINCTHRTILVWLKKYDIEIRSISTACSNDTKLELKNETWLYQKYIIDQLSCKDISKLLKCSSGTVSYWLKFHNISLRTVKQANKNLFKYGTNNPMSGKTGQNNPFCSKIHTQETKERISKINRGRLIGNKNPAWQGGRTSLIEKIRKTIQYINWRNSIYIRDGYKCIKCEEKSYGNFEVDHIKPFALIVKENKIETLEQAYNCLELWDINNGRTLCKECHKETETHGHKTSKLIKNLQDSNSRAKG